MGDGPVSCDICRDTPERHRIYGCRGHELKLIATGGCIDSAWVAIATLVAEGELEGYTLGLLDRPDPETEGTWIVNPFAAAD